MEIKSKKITANGTKFYVEENKQELGRAYLYILSNELHEEPFGFIEDVFIEESYRGKGIGSKLVKELVEEAKKRNCYKIILTTRYDKQKVHELYKNLGFEDHGKEFRINF